MSNEGDLGGVGLQCLSDLTREQATPLLLTFVPNICPCSIATAIFQKPISQLQNVVQGFKIWQNDRNTRTFWFAKILGQPVSSKNVKDLIIGRQIQWELEKSTPQYHSRSPHTASPTWNFVNTFQISSPHTPDYPNLLLKPFWNVKWCQVTARAGLEHWKMSKGCQGIVMGCQVMSVLCEVCLMFL